MPAIVKSRALLIGRARGPLDGAAMRMPKSIRSKGRILMGSGSSKTSRTHPSGAPSLDSYAHNESSARTRNNRRPTSLFTLGR